MRRLIGIAVLFLALSGVVAGGAYFVAKFVCAHQMSKKTDDLAWLREEFHLSEAELGRVRQLHEGYLPKCELMCGRIAEKKEELQAALGEGKGVTPVVESKLSELAALRSQCQIQMLHHFQEVSQAMPPEQGRRYLAEMQEMTLGFHEHFEARMNLPPSQPHGHH